MTSKRYQIKIEVFAVSLLPDLYSYRFIDDNSIVLSVQYSSSSSNITNICSLLVVLAHNSDTTITIVIAITVMTGDLISISDASMYTYESSHTPIYTYDVHIQCTHTMYTYNVHIRCTHTMYTYTYDVAHTDIHIRYTHTMYTYECCGRFRCIHLH